MKFKKIDSELLAKYILAKLGPTNHLKLQKILYYMEAWHLAFFGKPIIDDEFEAWVHGPVSKKIWRIFKGKSVLYDDIEIGFDKKDIIKEVKKLLSPEQLEVLDEVLQVYGKETAISLERYTHSEKPWRMARKGLTMSEASDNIISKKSMEKYYKKRLEEAN